jgi:P27 family predicted phage terminase small subunit
MSKMGRPATPVALQLVRGDPRQRGKAALAAMLDEKVRPAVEIPSCPAHLSAEAKSEWRRITKHLEKLGLISEIDRAALAGYCTAWGDYVWAEQRIAALNAEAGDKTGERGRIWDTPSGYKQISVPMQIRNRALEMMAKFLVEFGMSPAARSRVTASDPQMALPGMEKAQEGGWGTFPDRPASSA